MYVCYIAQFIFATVYVRNSQATLRFFSSDKDPFENIKKYLRFSLFFLQARTSIKVLFSFAKVCFKYLGQM